MKDFTIRNFTSCFFFFLFSAAAYGQNSKPPPTPGAITGDTVVCGGTMHAYTIAAVPGATNYTWSVSYNMTIFSGYSIGLPGVPEKWDRSYGGQGTTFVTISYGIGFNEGTISVVATNASGKSTPSTLNITKATSGCR